MCHSATVEESKINLSNDEELNTDESLRQKEEIYEDEFENCSTFCKISISSSDRLITLKKIVEKKFGISFDDQIIVYKDKILKYDLKTLQNYHFKQYSRIHIFDERDLKENVYELEDEVYDSEDNSSSKIDEKKAFKEKEKKIKPSNPRKEKSSVQRKIERSKEITNHKKEMRPEAIFSQSTSTSATNYSYYYNDFQNNYNLNQNNKYYTISKRSNTAIDNYYTSPRTRNLENMFDKKLNLYGYHQ